MSDSERKSRVPEPNVPGWYYDATGSIKPKVENKSSVPEELKEGEVKVEQSTGQKKPSVLTSKLDTDAQLGPRAKSSGTDLRHTNKG